MKNAIKYIGVFVIGSAPYFVRWDYAPILFITGLTLISFDIFEKKQWHLIGLNIVSGTGWIIALIKNLQ